MISDARGGHVSPGIYTEEKDVTYAVKSLGLTSLGLVGETLYGPAFENVQVKDWSEFVDYFGGTSPEKFKGTGLPKYELPYVAKSYLEQSNNLNVVRVLGLSGYHAGPAWIVTTNTEPARPVIILRSKMRYGINIDNICEKQNDDAEQIVESIAIGPYTPAVYTSNCVKTDVEGKSINGEGKFSIIVTMKKNIKDYANETYRYNVSLNEGDSDYIYRVISTRPDNGTTPIYIEALYENAIETPVDKWYAQSGVTSAETSGETSGVVYTATYTEGDAPTDSAATYEVISDAEFGEKPEIVSNENNFPDYVNLKYTKVEKIKEGLVSPNMKFDDFTDTYRPAQTPWFVSEAYASTEGEGDSATTTVTLKKLFKFITISDGDVANYQVKVSIQNIRPEEGTFDVLVRDFNDNDNAPLVLERFSRCSMVEGSSSYIAFKIGTADGGYVSKSKYIAVEMADNEEISNSVPCGFIGFPMPTYVSGSPVVVDYNTVFRPDIKAKRQYFGGIGDTDVLKYKGKEAYDNNGDAGVEMITNGFHMDSVLSETHTKPENVYVDGVSGYVFTTVSTDKVTPDKYEPRLINAPDYVKGTIYKDINTRKFTSYFYGGFDGWDINRESRTNIDDYKATKYPIDGSKAFTQVEDNGLNKHLDLPSTAITSDYYAYLAGYRVFANPQDIDINLFATPGIDWYNNNLLTEDVIDIIEDRDNRGGDALYVMAAPYMVDGDVIAPDDLARMFNGVELDSSYACTYYPWIMYYDNSNKRYLNLPATKDVVRNMAETDNNTYPWFAPAGMQRGNVNCVKAVYKTTLDDEDTLYENMINPVKSFAKDGVKIWGNKTAYKTDSPLNRINVRRLMIRVKKLIVDASKYLIFEPYDVTLEKQFKGIVEPILADVKANRGIYDYRVITESTEETRDQHILPAKILIKPTPSLEYISISFVVYPESVSFEAE